MPTKIVFIPEIILAQAFEIVRQKGLDTLSARRIARELGCSTQPTYKSYRSMLELQKAVIEKPRHMRLLILGKNWRPHRPSYHLACGIFTLHTKNGPCLNFSLWMGILEHL
jgi:hypothetical protein